MIALLGAALSGAFGLLNMVALIVLGVLFLLLYVHVVGGAAFKVMDCGARGMFDPAENASDPADPGIKSLPWTMFAMSFITGLVAGVLGAMSTALGVAAQLLLLLAWPAQLVVLTRDQSLGSAVNPLRWFDVMRGIGMPYLVLAIFLWLLFGGMGVAGAMLLPLFGKRLLLPAGLLVGTYFSLVMAYLMARAMFQYHDALGFTLDARAEGGTPDNSPAARIAKMIADGHLGAALGEAYEDQQRNPDNLGAHERYQRVLMLAGERDRSLSHGQRYLTLLMRAGMTAEALKLLVELRGIEPETRPDDANHELPLAESALRRQEPDLALALVRSFDRRHPNHRDIPAIYLFTARLLATRYRDDKTAVAILRTLLKRYPHAPAAVEAKILLDSLLPGAVPPPSVGLQG